ncbi:uncharacterized protein TNCV_800491 [Trichonephila clavipes]|nr:uncharacterized protein TNCV_800491 [Trichonephila clavipes]
MNKANLLFTDTDSLTYEIETEDIFKDMGENLDLYDLSEYPQDHAIYSEKNKKRIGCFKDEMSSKPIIEFVGLRAKMYSMLTPDSEKKTAKGVSKDTSQLNETSPPILVRKQRTCQLNKTIAPIWVCEDDNSLKLVNILKVPAEPKKMPPAEPERPPIEMVVPSVSVNTVEVTPPLITRCDKGTQTISPYLHVKRLDFGKRSMEQPQANKRLSIKQEP